MENISPTPLEKFNITGFKLSPLLRESYYKKLFGNAKFMLITKQVSILSLSLIISNIIHTLVYNTSLYYNHIRNMDPAILKIGRLNIKTRILANYLVKITLLIVVFILLHIAIEF